MAAVRFLDLPEHPRLIIIIVILKKNMQFRTSELQSRINNIYSDVYCPLRRKKSPPCAMNITYTV